MGEKNITIPLTLELFKIHTIMALYDIDALVENNTITKDQAWSIIKTFLIKNAIEAKNKDNNKVP